MRNTILRENNMEKLQEREEKMFRGLKSIAKELGCKPKEIAHADFWGLLDIVVKDIHIERILAENNRKEIKKLRREVDVLKQMPFRFYETMKKYS